MAVTDTVCASLFVSVWALRGYMSARAVCARVVGLGAVHCFVAGVESLAFHAA